MHLQLAGSRCLAVQHRPLGPVRGGVLLFPALAEELNKTRRATALAAQAMAARGWAVLQVDWMGSGDSEGDFGDARWSTWLAQAAEARVWWAAQHPGRPQIAWGLRAGCLMASALDRQAPWDGQLWWQPVVKGQTHWQQWLRLKQAAGLAEGAAGSDMAALKAATARGEAVEIAGYTFAAEWVQGLVASELTPPHGPALWLEASSQQPPALLPATQALTERWGAAPLRVQAVTDRAPWAALELEDCPALVDASLAWWEAEWPA
jgi:exosortase A-associated hydrolase 2